MVVKVMSQEPAPPEVPNDKKIKAARERQAWRKSEEYRKAKRLTLYFIFFTPIPAAVGAIISAAIIPDDQQMMAATYGATIGIGMWVYVILFWKLSTRSEWKQAYRDRLLLGEVQEEWKKADLEISAGATDLAPLWDATQKRLDLYHSITTTHAQRSFFWGRIAAGVGLATLLVSAIVAGLASSPTGSVVAGVAGLGAGGLSAYIGATYIKTQDRASDQLRAYFNQPVQFLNLLAAERLLDRLDSENQTAAIRDIITLIASRPADPEISPENLASHPQGD
ncbi:hypothetical protein ACIA98_12820 [Streptomyces sp. NPDC051366]|uniref:TRADD-N-associated membrane domain-containing protein n=1 Tax=Streptomyces sp. NPDC051366 TaxID=3365652 RepID=UPI0037B02F17